ncbi:MAG TPA: hypothetical protein VJN18_13325 [Polyangiaceae bacterium]|nr:hypothetical protein [Polyangiaceae bacterium]
MGAWDRRGLQARLAVLAGLSPLLCALPARAEPFQTAGAGAFLGYAFGEGGGFEWGVEGFATRYLEEHRDCGDSSERHGFGPLLRLSAVKVSRLELTLAGHIGGELPGMRSYFAIDGELGVSLFLEKRQQPRVAPHTGVTLESIMFNAYLRQEWLTPAFSVGGGARFIPTFGLPGFCEVGRPYRDECGEARTAGVAHHADFDRADPRAALWSERAADECASVPAFLQLALELADLDAPLELVARAVQAAEEELGHTHAAAGLAERFGGQPVLLAPPQFRARGPLPRPLALRRLAREAWLDGCLNEGLAAALAAAEARDSSCSKEAQVAARIAREEASHAALAFEVLGWALREVPDLASELRVPAVALRPRPNSSFLKPAQRHELAHSSARHAEGRLRELRAG